MNKPSGFTIIELMLTIVVLGIALAFAVPSMQQFIMNNRLTSQLNLLSTNLALARSEAIKQNVRVVVCASADGESCEDAGASWNDGWIIYINRDGDLEPNLSEDACAEGAGAADGDCLLIAQPALTGPNVLTPASGVSALIGYDGTGAAFCDADEDGVAEACESNDTYFTMCDPRGAEHARALAVSNTGRVSILDKTPAGDSLSCE